MRFPILAIASSIFIVGGTVTKTTAQIQIPFMAPLVTPNGSTKETEKPIVSGWVYLDGRQLFTIAAERDYLPKRIQNIQRNLQDIIADYLETRSEEIIVEIRSLNNLPVIFVNDQYLMTITKQDAGQLEPEAYANQIKDALQANLPTARKERQTQYLIQQGQIAAGSFVVMLLTSWVISRQQKRLKIKQENSTPSTCSTDQPITTLLNQQQQLHLQEVKKRLFQLAQAGVWGSGSYFILGLFPYTRLLQVGVLAIAQIPLRVGVVVLGTYVVIRFTYFLIDRFTSTIVNSGSLLTPETSERLKLRVSTFSGVTKSIATLICVTTGILVALIALGIDVVPLLAGAGLVGVAVSLASQNLIKDAINGFLIILEDQYALGDVIAVGDVGGLVENLNLRMTQLRDAEGRLITIPNSEIKIVANLSSRWSRADLTIPVSYQADITSALELIENVALKMNQEPKWQKQILEKPNVLGIDNFSDRGLLIRVWIKTQPLKQWEVAREYRRRLKIALDEVGISIPVPQQAIWINEPQKLNFQQDGISN